MGGDGRGREGDLGEEGRGGRFRSETSSVEDGIILGKERWYSL
jgi:hypothetical protein